MNERWPGYILQRAPIVCPPIGSLLSSQFAKALPGNLWLAPLSVGILIFACLWPVSRHLQRRLQRRVAILIAEDLHGGRLPKCIRCDYDLHATDTDTSPECGASTRIDDWRRRERGHPA